MHNSVLFGTFDPLRDVPEACNLCGLRPPIFRFEFQSEGEEGGPRTANGFCCEPCAGRLLKTLERTESREWTAEEAALAADDLDTTEFHKRLEALRSALTS